MFSKFTNEIWATICIVLATLMVVASLTAMGFYHEASGLQSKLDNQAGARKEALKSADRDYNKTENQIEHIKTVYKPQYVAIQTFVKVKDETDSNATIRLINNTIF